MNTPKYEINFEPDDGFDLAEGQPWSGWRVRYRRHGVRRWSTFLLSADQKPTAAQLLKVIRFHETGGKPA